MPALTEEDLFDFETYIEDPLAVALEALLAGVQVLTPRTSQSDEEHKVTPRIELNLSVHSSPEHHSTDRAGVEYRDTRDGSLSFLCSARRDAGTGKTLGQVCGMLRANLRKGKTILNPTNCPFYEITYLEEVSATPQSDADNDEIQRLITADITWWIKPSAFPVGP